MKPSDTKSPKVSNVVPVWNAAICLASVLSALRTQDYPADRLEVIVVDNGSEGEQITSHAEPPTCRLLWESAPGSYRARNRGIEASRGEVLAFTDSDCVPASDWVSAGVRRLTALENPGLLAGAVDVIPADAVHPTLAELFEMILGFPQRAYVERGHSGATCNLFTTREVIGAVGPFGRI